jgi:hypothetical protein
MKTDPFTEARERVSSAKQAYTVACKAVLDDAPNAAEHARIALRGVNQARAELRRIEEGAR